MHQCAFLAPQNTFTKLKFVMILVTLFNPTMNVSYPKSKTWTCGTRKMVGVTGVSLNLAHVSRESRENYAP